MDVALRVFKLKKDQVMQLVKFKKSESKKEKSKFIFEIFDSRKSHGGLGAEPPTSKKVREVGLPQRGFFEDSDIWVHTCKSKNTQKTRNGKHIPKNKNKTYTN
jgi:hypothetical protein